MSHTCHAYACNANVPPRMFMCKPHWFSLPKALRDDLWETYRPGQERDLSPSHDYCVIAARCVRFVAKKEGHDMATVDASEYVQLYVILDPEGGAAVTCPYCDSENVIDCGEISDTQHHFECVACKQGFPVTEPERGD